MIEEKFELMETPGVDRRQRRDRFRRFRAINDALRPYVKPLRNLVDKKLADMEPLRDSAAVFGDREYAWVLHDRDRLRRLFEPLGRQFGADGPD